MNQQPTFVPLRCLAGAGAPPELVTDLRLLAALPQSARQQIWTVLGPALNRRLPADMDARGAAFARDHELEPRAVASLLRAYRMILRNAFLVAASPRDVASDLDDVAADAAQGELLREAILPGFPAARALLQQEASGGAIGDHGQLLVNVDWRLDRLVASTRGSADDAFVGMLTLTYREGDKHTRLTMQALPDTVAQLRNACDSMLAAAERAGRASEHTAR